jgi:hypothetical protein
MKTKASDSSGTPGLPPAPAPPSRDVNPWPMSGQREAAPKVHPRARAAVTRRDHPVEKESMPSGGQKLSWLPYLMLVFVVATSLRVAIEAFEGGNVEAAVGPLIAIAFVAFLAWRRIRRRR